MRVHCATQPMNDVLKVGVCHMEYNFAFAHISSGVVLIEIRIQWKPIPSTKIDE